MPAYNWSKPAKCLNCLKNNEKNERKYGGTSIKDVSSSRKEEGETVKSVSSMQKVVILNTVAIAL